MVPHSSTLAWEIPWTEEPGGLQSMGLLRVGHDWVTSLSLFTFMHWRRKWQPIPVFLPGEPRDGKAWWAAVYGVAQSRTWLKRLSSSSNEFQNVWQKGWPQRAGEVSGQSWDENGLVDFNMRAVMGFCGDENSHFWMPLWKFVFLLLLSPFAWRLLPLQPQHRKCLSAGDPRLYSRYG